MSKTRKNQLELKFELKKLEFPILVESSVMEPPEWLGKDGRGEDLTRAVAGTKRVGVGKHLETPCFHGRERSW